MSGELSSHGHPSFLVCTIVCPYPELGSLTESGERVSRNSWCPRFDGLLGETPPTK